MDSDPWARLRPATVKYHENNLHSWIKQPANTWSNLAYVIVGLWLIYQFRAQGQSIVIGMIPVTAILIGVTSFMYHASYSFVFQISDLSSMYLLSSLLIALNAKRLFYFNIGQFYLLYFALLLTAVVSFISIKRKSGIVIFAAQVLVTIVLEVVIWLGGGSATDFGNYALMLAFLVLSFAFWILDLKGVLFRPDNHLIQGHAIWHVGSSFCFVFLYNHVVNLNL